MNHDFLLVHQSILPDYFPLVIQARELVIKEGKSVSEACKAMHISRSTFYKYKDYVFLPNHNLSKRVILAFRVEDIPGVLNSILTAVSENKANVLTIHQDNPIHGLAYINMMINTKDMEITLDELLERLSSLDYVKKAEVLAYD